MKKRIAMISALLVIAIASVRIYIVNTTAELQRSEIYDMNNWVDLAGNYQNTFDENTKGYSINVKSATLTTYLEFVKKHGAADGYISLEQRPYDIIDIEVEMKNEGNTDGYIFLLLYNLQNQSMNDYLVPNSELWKLATPTGEGKLSFALKPDTQFVFHIPYTINSAEKLQHQEYLEDSSYFLVVSHSPIKKMIRVSLEDTGTVLLS